MTAHSKAWLFACARSAGERLFGDHRSGLVFPTDIEMVDVVHESLTELHSVADEDMGTDAYVDDYEYVFFPSRPGAGLDVSGDNWADGPVAWRDSDGLIYTAYAEGVIRVVDPMR